MSAFRGLKWYNFKILFVNTTQRIRKMPYIFQASISLRMLFKAPLYFVVLRYALKPSPPITSNIAEPELKLPRRLKRFRAFSSIEYDGVEYMTPRDFLDSIIQDSPRERVFRRVITKGQLKSMLAATPPLRKGSSKMFRSLGDNGLISYAEYLFLITLLTKSQYAFNVAFLMFDEDENLQIDKKEFLIIISLLISAQLSAHNGQYNEGFLQSCSLVDDMELPLLQELTNRFSLSEHSDDGFLKTLSDSLESLVYNSQERYRNQNVDESNKLVTDFIPAEKLKNQDSPRDTTILVHLFGRNGKTSLLLDQFQIFCNNLQREIIEIEFHEFARGKDEISSVDFARLVLRYSILHKNDYSQYIRRIYERSKVDEEGITLHQFEQFSMFLNNLEDFAKAVRLYTAADIPVSRTEFIRAVKCSTGFNLDEHLVNVLYNIFDANGDDKLSYSEFIAIMDDRLHRGFRKSYSSHHSAVGWLPFKKCMIHELSSF